MICHPFLEIWAKVKDEATFNWVFNTGWTQGIRAVRISYTVKILIDLNQLD